jgi:hypothetical protein
LCKFKLQKGDKLVELELGTDRVSRTEEAGLLQQKVETLIIATVLRNGRLMKW